MKKKSLIPEKTRIVGGSGEGTRKIYISREVYKEIFSFSKDKNICQCGGVLLGNDVVEDGCKYTIIRAFIEGKHSEGTSNSITFTKATWNYIDQERENYPEYDIVGWMHTNPDTGRKATEYDLFFQTRMFENKDIVAYIVDPVQIAEAFYYLDGGQLVRSNGFYVFTEAVMPKILPTRKSKASRKDDDLEELIIVEVPDDKDVVQAVEVQVSDVKEEIQVAEVQVPDVTMEMADEVGASLAADMAQAMEEAEGLVKSEADKENKTTDIDVVEQVPEAEPENAETEKETTESAEEISADEKEIRQLFEEAEKKVEEDDSDVEAYTGKNIERISTDDDALDVAIQGKGSAKVNVVVAILAILVVALGATIGISIKRIYQLEKEIDRLYSNDEVIAKYINTGSTEGTISTGTEETTVANAESASVDANAETTVAADTTAATAETQTVADATAETQAETTVAETAAQ